MLEKTFVMLKPDALERGIEKDIVKRIEDIGIKVLRKKEIYVTRDQAERLYSAHKGKEYFEPLIEYIMSGKVLVMEVEGEDAIEKMRKLMGPTNPKEAPKGTIRGDYKVAEQDSKVIKNTIHSSDSLENAKRELMIFFEE